MVIPYVPCGHGQATSEFGAIYISWKPIDIRVIRLTGPFENAHLSDVFLCEASQLKGKTVSMTKSIEPGQNGSSIVKFARSSIKSRGADSEYL